MIAAQLALAAGFAYGITITGPDGSTDTVTFTTIDDLISENLQDLDDDLEGLNYISSSISGNVITLTADTAA